ncbi:MAG TPA: carboxypeptidase regulatory-like domain-containing protein [Puia sp.]|nr:carboxypeptidase regulatory-like domain-containing protein [Puia sp.]
MKASAIKIVALVVIAASLFAFRNLQTGSIKGIVSPSNGAVRAWAETMSDTLKADVVNGSYEIINVKPGTYRVIIEAKPPFRNAAKENVIVIDGHATDAGEIKLEK